MNQKLVSFNKELRGKEIPDLHSGDVVKVHLKIKEGGKERVQMFEGLVIAIKGGQSSSPTITVRKVSHGVGVEMILPILSKNIQKIELVKSAKVRRAKLYYVRGLTAKQSRMKYKDIKEKSAKEVMGQKEEAKEVGEEEVVEGESEKKENPVEVEKK